MMKRTFCAHLVAFSILLVSVQAFATNFGLDVVTNGQVRQNANNQNEVPVNGYLGMTVAEPKWKFGGETNMRLFRDFTRKLDDYDLYQAVLHFQPVDALKIDFGRQFVNEGFYALAVDGLKFSILPPGYVDIVLFSGIPRNVEVGDFNRDDGLYTGLSVGLKNVPGMNAQIHSAWRKNKINAGTTKRNDEVLVGLNLSYQFNSKVRPTLYGLFEYDVLEKLIMAGTAGFDIYPTKRIALNFEFNNFNVNRNTDRPTILGIFTVGRMMTGSFSSTWTLVPDWLDFYETYSFQRVEIQEGVHKNGHLIDTGFYIYIDPAGLFIQPSYYFMKSWGGHVNGARCALHGDFFKDKMYVDLGVDFSIYKKITNDNDNAFSAVLWTGYEVVKGLTLSAGAEYNRNNLFNRDIRGSFEIAYHFDHESS